MDKEEGNKALHLLHPSHELETNPKEKELPSKIDKGAESKSCERNSYSPS